MYLNLIINSAKKDISNAKSFFDNTISCGEHSIDLILYPIKKLNIKLFPHTLQSLFLTFVGDTFEKLKKR